MAKEKEGKRVIEFIHEVSKGIELQSTDSFLCALSKIILKLNFLKVNDSVTRRQIEIFINKHFDIKAICNKVNNTSDIIDKNQIIVDLEMERKVRLILG